MQCCPRSSRQHCIRKITCSSSKQHCIGKILSNVYINIFCLSCQKKYEVIFPLLQKPVNQLANIETVARHSTQKPAKFLVGSYLNKKNLKSAMQCCQNPSNLTLTMNGTPEKHCLKEKLSMSQLETQLFALPYI